MTEYIIVLPRPKPKYEGENSRLLLLLLFSSDNPCEALFVSRAYWKHYMTSDHSITNNLLMKNNTRSALGLFHDDCLQLSRWIREFEREIRAKSTCIVIAEEFLSRWQFMARQFYVSNSSRCDVSGIRLRRFKRRFAFCYQTRTICTECARNIYFCCIKTSVLLYED